MDPATKQPRRTSCNAVTALVGDDLKNDRIVQLRIPLRKRSWYIDFQPVDERWPNPGLALQKLRNGLQRDSVNAKGISRIGCGESCKDGGGGRMLRAVLNAHAKLG